MTIALVEQQRHTDDQIRRKIAESCYLDESTGCWIWTKGKCSGYGWLFTGIESEYAHILSFELFKGKFTQYNATNVLVLHTCNNRSCVNPDHLYLGTRADNTNDALRDGAYADRVFLHDEDQQFICYLFSKGVTTRLIARMYLSSHTRIQQVLKSQSNYSVLQQLSVQTASERLKAKYSAALELKKKGYYNTDIAKELDISLTQVKRILKGDLQCLMLRT